MKVYGTRICRDCRNYLAIQANRGFEAEFVDITENTDNFKAYLKIRDNSDLYKPAREAGKIGIPLFIKEDGTMTLDADEAFSWIGQKPIEECEIIEKKPEGEA